MIKKKDLPKLKKTMLRNIRTDKGIERNDEIIEDLEDSFGINLSSYYGESDSKKIIRMFKKLR